MQLFTTGHSTLKIGDFLNSLKFFGVKKLIDVRSYPGSRHVPQFNKETLPALLKAGNIEYAHFASLGGRRKSPNQRDTKAAEGWKNASFFNYASYTMTEDYEKGIAELMAELKKKTVCIMCAESVPWRCHRLLISNTLVARGIEVFHIVSDNKSIAHKLNLYGAYAEVKDGKVVYPHYDLLTDKN